MLLNVKLYSHMPIISKSLWIFKLRLWDKSLKNIKKSKDLENLWDIYIFIFVCLQMIPKMFREKKQKRECLLVGKVELVSVNM
jgi:hypothetical protein